MAQKRGDRAFEAGDVFADELGEHRAAGVVFVDGTKDGFSGRDCGCTRKNSVKK